MEALGFIHYTSIILLYYIIELYYIILGYTGRYSDKDYIVIHTRGTVFVWPSRHNESDIKLKFCDYA